MAEPKNTANQRLTQIKDFLTMNKTATTIPWDPDCTKFPTRKELPQIPGAPAEAAWVWGDDDYVSLFCLDGSSSLTVFSDWPLESPHSDTRRCSRTRDQEW
jgi:hypothetical protein